MATAVPITWQNINGPSMADALRPMEAAQKSINTTIAGFQDVLKAREATDAANVIQIRNNETQDALNAIASIKGVNDYQNAQQNGFFEALQARGAAIDQAAVRNAFMTRLGQIQTQEKLNIEHGNAVEANNLKPIRDQLNVAVANRDLNAINAIGKTYAHLPGASALTVEAQKGLTSILENDLLNQTRDSRVKVANLAPDEINARIRSSNASADASKATAQAALIRAQVDKETFTAQQLANAAQRAANQYRESLKGTPYENGEASSVTAEEIAKIITLNPRIDEGERSKLLDKAMDIANNGLDIGTIKTINSKTKQEETYEGKIPVPKTLFVNALLAARDADLITVGWNSAPASHFEKQLQKVMQQVNDGRNAFIDGYQLMEAAKLNAVQNPVSTAPGVKPSPKSSGAPKPPKHPK